MKTLFFLTLIAIGLFAGCSSGVILKPADFSWPIEAVMKTDAKGFIQDSRNSISVNIKELLFTETGDSTNVSKWNIHVIRDAAGYYFVVAAKFRNVYVLSHADGGLKIEKKIPVNEAGLQDPAFNQRSPFVQLLHGKDRPVSLSKDGIQQGGEK